VPHLRRSLIAPKVGYHEPPGSQKHKCQPPRAVGAGVLAQPTIHPESHRDGAAPRRRRSVCQPTSRAVGAVVVSPALQRWEEAKKEENRSPGGTAPRPPRTSFWVYAPAPDSDTRKYRPFASSSCFDEIEMWIEGNPTRRSNMNFPGFKPLDQARQSHYNGPSAQ